MTSGADLLAADDEQIADAVSHADVMALRGLLYQLTGDPEVAATRVHPIRGYLGENMATGMTDEADIALLRAKAVAFLRSHRDAGAPPLDPAPPDRVARSLALAAGVDELPDEELWLEEVALDPWARGLRWREAPSAERLRDFTVVVIGAGMGGLGAAVQLQHAGIGFTVLEKNPEVGGTWYENRYPGARVDSPSRAYLHIFGVDFPCPYPWCTRDANQDYFTGVADHFGLRDRIEFDTEVTALLWDERSSTWEIHATGPGGARVMRADAVISAVGLLSRASLPEIEGTGSFAGRSFHTTRWPADLDLSDSRVAVIGTGSSGVQLAPQLALLSRHLTVFQRTPQWLFEHAGYLARFPSQVGWLDECLPLHRNFMRFRTNWLLSPYLTGPLREIDPDFDDPHARSAVNKQVRDERIAYIRKTFADRPDLAERMIPPHPPLSTRPVQVDAGYNLYHALLRDDVSLVDAPIERVTPTGIRTADGVDHQLDVIVYATGFKANECLWPMDVRGRDGRSVQDLWAKDGPRAYIGTMLPGFPNLFLIYGPNMNPYGGLGVVNHQEFATRFLLECLQELVLTDKRTAEVTEAAYLRYNDELDAREQFKIYKDPRARSYYRNEHGRSAVNCPFPGNEMWHRLRHPDFDDVILR
jgi:4-hydroxyacetophenone monooxygenase